MKTKERYGLMIRTLCYLSADEYDVYDGYRQACEGDVGKTISSDEIFSQPQVKHWDSLRFYDAIWSLIRVKGVFVNVDNSIQPYDSDRPISLTEKGMLIDYVDKFDKNRQQ